MYINMYVLYRRITSKATGRLRRRFFCRSVGHQIERLIPRPMAAGVPHELHESDLGHVATFVMDGDEVTGAIHFLDRWLKAGG